MLRGAGRVTMKTMTIRIIQKHLHFSAGEVVSGRTWVVDADTPPLSIGISYIGEDGYETRGAKDAVVPQPCDIARLIGDCIRRKDHLNLVDIDVDPEELFFTVVTRDDDPLAVAVVISLTECRKHHP